MNKNCQNVNKRHIIEKYLCICIHLYISGINDSDKRTVDVRYENLKECYIKKHCKLQKGKTITGCDGKLKQSWMRVQNGIVFINVECNMLVYGEQLFAEVLVGREKSALKEVYFTFISCSIF